MKKLKKLPFFIVLLSAISTLSLFSEESFIPKPPSLNASNYILMDSVSGRILAENNSDERIEPAITGRAAFLAPEQSISPKRLFPPLINNFSN